MNVTMCTGVFINSLHLFFADNQVTSYVFAVEFIATLVMARGVVGMMKG